MLCMAVTSVACAICRLQAVRAAEQAAVGAAAEREAAAGEAKSLEAKAAAAQEAISGAASRAE